MDLEGTLRHRTVLRVSLLTCMMYILTYWINAFRFSSGRSEPAVDGWAMRLREQRSRRATQYSMHTHSGLATIIPIALIRSMNNPLAVGTAPIPSD